MTEAAPYSPPGGVGGADPEHHADVLLGEIRLLEVNNHFLAFFFTGRVSRRCYTLLTYLWLGASGTG